MFKRQDQHKKKRLKDSWRKPKGLQNKQRLEKKGYLKKVKTGYMSQNQEIVHVSSISQLNDLKPCMITIGKLSKKNKVELIKEAQKKGFKFSNFSFKKYLDSAEQSAKEKKTQRKQKELKKKALESKKEEKEEKDKKENLENKKSKSSEDSKKEEKDQKDKVLTKSDKK